MIILVFIFWLSVFVIFWSYFGYFLTLKLISLVYSKKVDRKDYQPDISLIITAYNEEKRIAQKLDNTLALDYPRERLEIIVVSDASTDHTEEIVRGYADRGVKLLIIGDRHGKHYGQGRGIRKAAHDIVVLTDATTFLAPDAVKNIIGNFADPTIGCVSSRDQVISEDGTSEGEGFYVRYEMALRDLESRVGSLIGVSGSFFAVRKQLTDSWVNDMSSDFYMPSVARINGMRTISDNTAVGQYSVNRSAQKEFERKLRTVVHGLEVVFKFKEVLNPFRYGTFALQMISHKLCRWLVPFAMIAAFIANIVMIDQGAVYRFALAAQLVFYILVGFGVLFENLQKHLVFKLPTFFVMVNYSILVAWYKYWTGQKFVVWTATKR